nr:Bacterial alpha-L-rhamnosidase [Bacteroidota bacterium]
MKKIITVMLLGILFHACASKSDVQITQLRCEYLDSPLGIDEVNPRLSWIIESVEGGQKQTAYQVMVASTLEKLNSKNPDLWDSGKVKSNQSIQIEYKGKPLSSGMDCYWKVKIWDKKGMSSAWSDPALWSMGLLEKTDWKAKWIGADPNKISEEVKKDLSSSEQHIKIEQRGDPPIPPSPLLKKSFTIKKQIKKATVYATALGLYELRINGKKVGDYVLAPEWTDYNKRVQYQTFDVTGFLNQGENVIGATLADGWYMGFFAQWGSKTPSRGENYGSLDRKLLVQLEIVTTDDQTDTVITDETWQIWNDGPVRSADMFLGEVYDTRKEIMGWDMPEFDDSKWENASEFPATEAELVAQMNEPIRIVKELKPIAVTEPETGTYIFDMGQNMVGWCRLMVNEPEVTKIRLRHGEMLTMDGGIYVENLRMAKQEDIFLTNGKGENTFEPRFTYHGFRYVEVTGLSKKPTPEMLTGMVVASNADLTGKFECSNSNLNQIWKNTLWSQRGNMHSTPTDCPQRDERMGWMGDAQVFSQTAIFNMNMAAFFSKWIQDIRDAQQQDGRYA